ncbi:glycosyltransferase family 1 protein, partial [Salmonella enterica subsp. enterica serovar Caracas]|nr:glycosyltransferase family 1 protein [Salmonella enterica subsp. enterica serovar Caracas]
MIILYTESSPNIGGQELQALSQMQALRDRGHTVALVCKKNSRIAFFAKKIGIMVFFVSFKNSIDLLSVFKLMNIVYKLSVNIIVCHSGHDSNIVGIVRILLRKKVFVIRQKTYITNKVRPFSLNYMNDLVIVPGCEIKDSLVNAGCKENKIHIIPPGFEFNKMQIESELTLPEHILSWLKTSVKYPLIVQVGMLRPEKGHGFIIDILEMLKKEKKNFRYLIIGDGKPEYKKKLRNKITSKNLWDRVYMAGEVYPVMPVYKYADLVVVPSRNESFGMTVVEASYMEIPVFASNVGGLAEIIQSNINGILLPVDNKCIWAATLCDYLNNPDDY